MRKVQLKEKKSSSEGDENLKQFQALYMRVIQPVQNYNDNNHLFIFPCDCFVSETTHIESILLKIE